MVVVANFKNLYAKVNTVDKSLVQADWVPLPGELRGLSPGDLRDLSVIAIDRSDLNGVGYWNVDTLSGPILVPGIEIDTQPGSLVINPDNTVTRVYTLSAQALTATRAYMAAQLALKRYSVETQGVTVSGLGFAAKTDLDSQTRIEGALIAANAGLAPPQIKWKDILGNFHVVTPQQCTQIFAAAALNSAICFAHESDLKDQVDASNDPGSIDITAGWPDPPQSQAVVV